MAQQYVITFTDPERQALLQLLDTAVRLKGLEVAETAVVLTKIILSVPGQEVPEPVSKEQAEKDLAFEKTA